MKKIQSFTVNHDILEKGVYLSRVDGNVRTYDLRFVKPNTPPYLDPKAMHTVEHLCATYARNSDKSDNVIYFGPMGCRTGFYFLTTGLDDAKSLELIKDVIKKSMNHNGEIPGNSRIECGNYLEHDLDRALQDLRDYYEVIKDKTVADLAY